MTSLTVSRILLRNTRTLGLANRLTPFIQSSSVPHVFPRCSCSENYLGQTSFLSTSPIQLNKKQAETDGDDDLDKPIKFTTSQAATTTAYHNLSGDAFPDSPWWQPYVVILSTGAFLLYFLYLREENDIDEQMKIPLWQRIPGLEKKQLQIVYEYNEANGLDNTDIVNRMRELEEEDRIKAKNASKMAKLAK